MFRNKFKAIRTDYNGKTYHSKSEANYAKILMGLLEEGKIKDFKEQVKYPLPNIDGKMTLRYVSDFNVILNDGREVIIDVKGVLTAANKVKLAYVKYYHGVDVVLIPTTGIKKFNLDWLPTK